VSFISLVVAAAFETVDNNMIENNLFKFCPRCKNRLEYI
jgi:hypothetical protein